MNSFGEWLIPPALDVDDAFDDADVESLRLQAPSLLDVQLQERTQLVGRAARRKEVVRIAADDAEPPADGA